MQTFHSIQRIIHDVCGLPIEEIAIDSTADQLHLHDLDMAEVVSEVEEQLDVLLDDEVSITSVRELVARVEQQLCIA